jgi:hypothetical protein
MGAAIALLSPSLAAGAPSGDEYLPKVPKAAGKEVVANPEQKEGASVLEPAIRGSEPTDTTEETSGSSGSSGSSEPAASPQKTKKSADKEEKRESAQASILPSSDDDDSSGSVLFNPIILLVIAGVVAATVGMILRRRQDERSERAEREGDGARGPHPTPDGEIVAGGDEAV